MSYAKSLKRKRFNQPEEITFDFSARQDYLTGFHKRKLERAKHAQDAAVRREKEIRLETRRQLRAERKSELEKYVKSVDELMTKEGESWDDSGTNDDAEDEDEDARKPQLLDYEDNYSDEDRHTTVLIEEVDVTRQGLTKLNAEDDETEDIQKHSKPSDHTPIDTKSILSKKRKWTKDAPRRDKTKKKRPRYETKAERKVTRSKERSGGAKARAKRKGRYT